MGISSLDRPKDAAGTDEQGRYSEMTDQPAAAGRLLSGEFGSPAHVLASEQLSTSDKRGILEQWLRDLEPHDDTGDVAELRATVKDALDRLPADNS